MVGCIVPIQKEVQMRLNEIVTNPERFAASWWGLTPAERHAAVHSLQVADLDALERHEEELRVAVAPFTEDAFLKLVRSADLVRAREEFWVKLFLEHYPTSPQARIAEARCVSAARLDATRRGILAAAS